MVEIYDQNRNRLKQAKPKNPGAIVNTSWTPPSAQYVYISVSESSNILFPDIFPEKTVSTYTLVVAIN